MEQFKVYAHILQLVPLGQINRVDVEVVDFGIWHGQEERGVRGYDELGTAAHREKVDDFGEALLEFA